YRNFCNKLWNAARYVLMNTEGQDCGQNGGAMELNAADRWITARLQEVATEAETAFREYRFDLAAQAIYSFVWHEYCDWYLELSKVVLTDPKSRAEQLRGTRWTLAQALETALRLLHPVMPFITEEIWQRVARLAGKTGATIMREPYPRSQPKKIDHKIIDEMRWIMAVITGVRNIRGEMNISPGKLLPLLIQDGSATDKTFLEASRHYLAALARAESVTWLEKGEHAPESATALVGHMKVLIPLGSLIDKGAELERLGREMEKIEKDLTKARTKLANADFVARAPQNVVEQEKDRVRQLEIALAKLRSQRAKVESLPG
ncbi:MAG TPA: class I tRNA ligase family protein, partial [Candidatus Methylomirabilis sp.]|nr:class I tRNA ligase family protein [Candidatus Methylomirabilis sp.]